MNRQDSYLNNLMKKMEANDYVEIPDFNSSDDFYNWIMTRNTMDYKSFVTDITKTLNASIGYSFDYTDKPTVVYMVIKGNTATRQQIVASLSRLMYGSPEMDTDLIWFQGGDQLYGDGLTPLYCIEDSFQVAYPQYDGCLTIALNVLPIGKCDVYDQTTYKTGQRVTLIESDDLHNSCIKHSRHYITVKDFIFESRMKHWLETSDLQFHEYMEKQGLILRCSGPASIWYSSTGEI